MKLWLRDSLVKIAACTESCEYLIEILGFARALLVGTATKTSLKVKITKVPVHIQYFFVGMQQMKSHMLFHMLYHPMLYHHVFRYTTCYSTVIPPLFHVIPPFVIPPLSHRYSTLSHFSLCKQICSEMLSK